MIFLKGQVCFHKTEIYFQFLSEVLHWQSLGIYFLFQLFLFFSSVHRFSCYHHLQMLNENKGKCFSYWTYTWSQSYKDWDASCCMNLHCSLRHFIRMFLITIFFFFVPVTFIIISTNFGNFFFTISFKLICYDNACKNQEPDRKTTGLFILKKNAII